jgi:hypothetical protein
MLTEISASRWRRRRRARPRRKPAPGRGERMGDPRAGRGLVGAPSTACTFARFPPLFTGCDSFGPTVAFLCFSRGDRGVCRRSARSLPQGSGVPACYPRSKRGLRCNLGPFREGRPSFLPTMLCAGFEFTKSEICTKCTPISRGENFPQRAHRRPRHGRRKWCVTSARRSRPGRPDGRISESARQAP